VKVITPKEASVLAALAVEAKKSPGSVRRYSVLRQNLASSVSQEIAEVLLDHKTTGKADIKEAADRIKDWANGK